MSLCLVIETKNNVWLGGDSVVSYTVNGKSLRSCNEMEKAFSHKNAVFFVCGGVYAATLVRRYIESLPIIKKSTMPDIAAKMRLISAGARPFTDSNVKLALIAVLLDDGRVYGINENNNFIIESPIKPELQGYKYICCVGVNDDYAARGRELAERFKGADIPKMYAKVYSDLSCEEIGGHVDLYQLDIQNQSITRHYVTLTEREDIKYIDARATMTNGSIQWENVNSDPVATNAASTANSAYNTANNAQSSANEAKAAASAVDTALAALKSGLGYTFIDGQNVISPNIRGGTISSETSVRAGRYYNKDGDAYFEVGDSSFGDFTLWGSGNNRVFQVYDDVGAMGLRAYGKRFLTAGSGGAYPEGNWDFTSANVIGLTAVFA